MFPEIQRRFRSRLAAAMGIDPSLFQKPGTIVAASPDREGSRLVSAFAVAEATILWCDPLVADRVASLSDEGQSFPIGEMEAWASAHGAEYVGGARSHLIGPELLASPPLAPGYRRRFLDGDDPGDLAVLTGLLEECDEDDVDAIDLDLDDLDRLLIGVFDAGGHMAGMASERPWDHDGAFADIAVLVHPGHRRLGIGAAAVARVCDEDFALGRMPLYRCNWDREASRRLALSLGFIEVLSLAAIRFDQPDRSITDPGPAEAAPLDPS